MLDLLRQAKKVGFLFSGGSSRCVFQIGVVETLYDLGVTPAATLGVSAGSWNAAAVAVGNWRRLRPYWRFFCRMPYIDLGNLLREHSPFIWTTLHKRAFDRYIGAATGELLDFGNDIALLGIEHDVRAHSFRHFHSNGIAFHTDDERSAHQFRPGGGAQADGSLGKNCNCIADANIRRFRAAESGRRDICE